VPFEKGIRVDEADGADLIAEGVLGSPTSTPGSKINNFPRRTPQLRLPGMGVVMQVSAVGHRRGYYVRVDVYYPSRQLRKNQETRVALPISTPLRGITKTWERVFNSR